MDEENKKRMAKAVHGVGITRGKLAEFLHEVQDAAEEIRDLECANMFISGLRKAPTPGLDDSNFKPEDFEAAGG